MLKYYKLLDDISDKRGIKRIAVKTLLPFAKKHLKAAIREFPELRLEELSRTVSESLKALSELETDNSSSPDACADAFGYTLSAVFSHALHDEERIRIAKDVGYRIGRWIYLADAINDFDSDKKSGSFNPFISSGYDELSFPMLSNCLTMELGIAFDLLKDFNYKYADIENIIINTLTLGMPHRVKLIAESSCKNTRPE